VTVYRNASFGADGGSDTYSKKSSGGIPRRRKAARSVPFGTSFPSPWHFIAYCGPCPEVAHDLLEVQTQIVGLLVDRQMLSLGHRPVPKNFSRGGLTPSPKEIQRIEVSK
jgi:hypothetical protein